MSGRVGILQSIIVILYLLSVYHFPSMCLSATTDLKETYHNIDPLEAVPTAPQAVLFKNFLATLLTNSQLEEQFGKSRIWDRDGLSHRPLSWQPVYTKLCWCWCR
ncbi:hypothetical protein DER45DRAFT_382122 [Fusarium avenaceum]|nr:hypothetical protein DER45DRAFT_382122 [Fusarium avenaceum]